MITCSADPATGVMTVYGDVPNGAMTVTRNVPGKVPYLLRNGAQQVTSNGFILYDTEAPFSVPLTYQVTVSGIAMPDRIIQNNLLPTPDFDFGAVGWLPGTGRTLAIENDATARSSTTGFTAKVAHISGNATSAPGAAAPTLVGHVDSTVFTSSTYTLVPTISGGTAVALNDWMVLVHQQASAAAAPTVTSGWTLLSNIVDGTMRQTVWTRKRDAGDMALNLGVQVTVAAGAGAIGTLLWIRGGTQDVTLTAPPIIASGLRDTMTSGFTSSARPHLALTVFSVSADTAGTAPSTGSVTGGTWSYTKSSGTDARTMVVAVDRDTAAGLTPMVQVQYASNISNGMAVQFTFEASTNTTNRVIARAKMTALPGTVGSYRVTGRFRFTSQDINTWQDIRNIGTWAQVKAAKANWLAVRGTAITVPISFLKLFVTIVDPVTGADYVPPMLVQDTADVAVNTWIDFSALFSTSVTIPATAELRLMHGTTINEYGINWWLDEFGITPPPQWVDNDTLMWIGGNRPNPPVDSAARAYGPGWLPDGTDDSDITWLGTAGNSISVYFGPSRVTTSTTCQLDIPSGQLIYPCEPVLLSDPVNTSMAVWVGLLNISPLVHAANQAIYRVLSRAPAVAISQVRGWPVGELTVITNTLEERTQLLTVFASGRILLIRNPWPGYVETDWYLACGDLTESRPIPQHRVPQRTWTIPFTRVERPTGLINASGGITWQDVKNMGTWADVRAQRDDWLAVLTGDES